MTLERILFPLSSILLAAPLLAQIPAVTNETATPIAGTGHDYRSLLSETVSPASGSLSIRIALPLPASRGVTLPFSINYDSAGLHSLTMIAGQGYWVSPDDAFIDGGWAYSVPLLRSGYLAYVAPVISNPGETTTCNGQNDFVFTNPNGERHSFPNITYFYPYDDQVDCPATQAESSEDRYSAQVTDTDGDVKVMDHDGTVYTFLQSLALAGTGQLLYPSTIEDRNGNKMTMSASGGGYAITDSTGREVVSWNGFGETSSLTVSGLSPFQIVWGTATSNFSVGFTEVSGNNCRGINEESGSLPVITSIALPNGEQYQFQYESTYGLLNKVIYPNGAYSRYVWALNSRANQIVWPSSHYSQTQTCTYTYDTPAVQHRYVSYDGVNEVLQDDYSYSTTWAGNSWSSKSSVVTTTVKTVQNGSLTTLQNFSTTYNYSPYSSQQNMYDLYNVANQLPIESSIVYKNSAGTQLRSIAETWLDQFLMSSKTTTLDDGSTSKVTYTYIGGELATQTEYDFGAGAPGAALKQTTITYQPFATTPILGTISDRPCKIIAHDGTGTTRYAETDYYYDGGTSLCTQTSGNATASIAGLTSHDETGYGSSSTAPRGNATRMVQQVLQTGATPTTSYSYDESGQLAFLTDPNGNTTSYSHLDSYESGEGTPAGQTNAYLTKITRPNTGSSDNIAHIEHFAYRFIDGQLYSSSDENSQTTRYLYNDSLGRLTETDYPDGGKVTTAYNDSGSTPSQTTSKLLSSSSTMVQTTVMDGAGHPIETKLTSDPSGAVYTMTAYDGLGRPWSVSNPYRSTQDATYGLVTYSYDALGRVVQVANPDGSNVTTAYAGPKTTVTDEAGCQKSQSVDGAGRLTTVVEDPSSATSCNGNSSHLGYSTTYSYDPLDNLTGVAQGAETRTFNYDSLKRLISATNPESGTIGYTYDSADNLQTRKDNRGITTTYYYDALNRNTSKTYSDGMPSVTYTYDPSVANGIGRLGSEANSAATTNFTGFDAMGRVTASSQQTALQTYGFTYAYNLAGSLTSETYPSGRTVTTSYDAANREVGVSGTLHGDGTSYVSDVNYWPHGVPYYYAGGNGLWLAATYNSRLQATYLWGALANSSAKYLYQLNLNWGTTNDNGNLLGVLEYAGGPGQLSTLATFSQSFTYDGVNRLSSASDSGGWSRSFAYDQYGNGWVTGATGMAVSLSTPTGNLYVTNVNGTNVYKNQIGSSPYDAAGNMLKLPPGYSFTYDAENRQTGETNTIGNPAVNYAYDGDGRRVEKVTSGVTTVYVYDALGRLAAQYTSGNAETGPCQTCYLAYDHLGSVRLVTDELGVEVGRHDYLPFGEEIPAGVADRDYRWDAEDTVAQKFTGKERDSESGLDYFGARYFGSSMGRFMSPDPLGGDLTNPQSLNRYAYVLNNPLTNTDPTGMYTCTDSKDCSSKKDQALEKTLAGLRNSKDADVARAANAYGAQNKDNGVSVGFADLSKSGKGGDTVSTIGVAADGSLRANSAITLNSKDGGTDFTADVGHEGSHAADAQDVVGSGLTEDGQAIHAGMNITPYQSEQRAYGVTNSILNSVNESRNYVCGSGGCLLGRGATDIPGTVDRLVGSNPIYNQGGRPMSSTNQGPSVVNGVTPKATVPSVPH